MIMYATKVDGHYLCFILSQVYILKKCLSHWQQSLSRLNYVPWFMTQCTRMYAWVCTVTCANLGHSVNQSMVQQLTREGNIRQRDLKESPTGLMHTTMWSLSWTRLMKWLNIPSLSMGKKEVGHNNYACMILKYAHYIDYMLLEKRL